MASNPSWAAFVRKASNRGPRDSGPPDVIDAVRQVEPGEDLVAQFLQAAVAAGVQAARCDGATWASAAADVVASIGPRVVLEAGAGFLDWARAGELGEALARRGVTVAHDDSDETLFDCPVSACGVFAAVAETGSLVCVSGPQTARGTTLIPPALVAILSIEQLLPDLADLFALLGSARDFANLTVITGPSKTADVEGVLVKGVHGPGVVHALLVDTGHILTDPPAGR